jgi:mannosyltransferase
VSADRPRGVAIMRNVIIDGIIFSLQDYGGISVYFRELIRLLVERGITGKVIIDEPARQPLEFITGSMALTSMRSRFIERVRACRVGPMSGVFHSSYYRCPSNSSMPSVVTVHDFVRERQGRSLKERAHAIQKRLAVERAQAVICISEATKRDLLEFIPASANKPIHVIHNGVSPNYCPIEYGESDTRFLLYVGSRRGYKNFSCAARAMEFLPEMELWCVGGEQPSTSDLSGLSVAVRKRIRFLGFRTESQLNQLYNGAHCLLYLSEYEGFGIPVAEAMRAGCPVVSINCIAVREVGGDALEVAPHNDPLAVAQAVRRLEAKDHRMAKVCIGLELSKRYSWQICHQQTLTVYESVSGSS